MSTEIPFHRRHLPHFYPPDAIYFITARLAGSLPQSVIDRARREREFLVSQRSEGKERSSGFPPYIDELEWWQKVIEKGNQNAHWLADPRLASLVAESIHYRDGKDYDLVAYTDHAQSHPSCVWDRSSTICLSIRMVPNRCQESKSPG